MTEFGELRMTATIENVRILAHFLDGIGQRLQLTERTLFDIQLATEEAAVNIVNHAYPTSDKGDLAIRVDVYDDMLHITLVDWGVPFDASKVKPFDMNAPVETRIKGGMGLHFINNLMDGVMRHTASKVGDGNTLTLIKRMEQLPPGIHQPSALRELNAMLSVSQVMTMDISLDELLERIVNELVRAIDAERGTLYLIDREKQELVSRVLLEDTGDLKEIRVRIGEGIAGQVAQNGKIMNIKEAYEHPNFSAAFDGLTGFRSRTMLAAPMRNHYQEIIGVVQLLNKKGGDFSTRDERLLMAMSAQAAISIENARLMAQEMRQRLIDQELETAKRIQISFLPQQLPQPPGWEIATFWMPMRDVGGDFYDFYRLPDGRWAAVIADVSGKGIPAAMFMAFGVTVLRFAMRLGFSPAELLRHANRSIIDNQQSRMFATVFVTYFDFATGRIEYGSGGHNPPLLYRASTQTCAYLEVEGVAMGLFPQAVFEEAALTMEPGDVLVMYTDGITEVIDENEDEFGEDRLEALVIAQASAGASAQQITEYIVETITRFCVDPHGFDDETLIVVKKQ
ncbi:MAG: hypothetical protein OHK0046_26300 [Anaerolineae bacterium]